MTILRRGVGGSGGSENESGGIVRADITVAITVCVCV